MKKGDFNGNKDIDEYFGNGMAPQSILANLLYGTEAVSKLCDFGFDVKTCMNMEFNFKMLSDIGAEFSNSHSMSMAMIEYDHSEDAEKSKLNPYLESARNMLYYWRLSTVARIHNEKPMLIKELFILPSNACVDDDLELYEYGSKYVFDLLVDIVNKIYYAYPNLDDRARPVIAEEITRYLDSIANNIKDIKETDE